MYYAQPVFRPLSEAQSLLIQATLGCSQPICTFCPVSSVKVFKVRPQQEIIRDMEEAAEMMKDSVKTIFLLAADAFFMDAASLIEISERAAQLFPTLRRISAYATAKDILRKTDAELVSIRAAGLNRLYVGVDSGSEEVLRRVNKRITARQTVDACRKASDCGFEVSTTVILGLGGKELTHEHADSTAAIISEIEPDYLGIVTLMTFPHTALGQQAARGGFAELDTAGLLSELSRMVGGLDIKKRKCVLRTNHPSNYIVHLAGTLPDDKERLTGLLTRTTPDLLNARAEMQRSL
jgi:radical SAM superfamily enzyme YgiQ (UPF0313 family)